MGRLVKSWGRVVPSEVVDASTAGRALLTDARRQAEEIVVEARRQAAAMRAEAYQQGQADAAAEFTMLLAGARADAARVQAAALPAARGLAARMAEKIVGRAIALDPAVAAEIAAQALAAARVRAGVVTLRIHPADRAAIEAQRADLLSQLGDAIELRVVGDPTVPRGGCVVDTPAGRLDARIASQLAALERAVFAEPARDAGAAASPPALSGETTGV